MNYELCVLHNKCTILLKYEQNAYFVQMLLVFGGVSIALECCRCERMRFNCTTVLVVLSICASYREHC